MEGAIQSLDVSYFVHATEDAGKVRSVVAALVGSDAPFESEELAGHFGNVITRNDLRLHGDEAARCFQHLMGRLPTDLREEIARDIDRYVDEHSSLYLRLDKQRLVQGHVAMGSVDVVRLKVKPRAFVMKGHARDFFTGALEGK